MTLKVTTWHIEQKDLVDTGDTDDLRKEALDQLMDEAEDYLLATVGIPMDNHGRVRMDLVEPSAGSRCHEHESRKYDAPRGTGFRSYTY